MAYTQFDAAKPDGATQAGAAFSTSTNANDKALRDAIVAGTMPGFVYAQSGGTAEEPATQTWTAGTIILRATNTWSSGNATTVVWELSTNSGSSYDSIGTEVRTVDGSGNVTATTGGGGILSWWSQWLGKFKALRTAYTAHAAATGTGAHGLGTVSTQAASAVAITGGAINGTSVGTSTPAEGYFSRAAEQFASYSPGSGAGVTVDWSKGGSYLTNSGTNALTFSNVAAARITTHAIYCSNFNSTTFPAAVNWGLGGKPSIAGAALAQLVTFDGGTTVLGLVAWKAA